MGLELEIERFFRESQTWDLEMLARSALPSYHSNYPTSPLPPGASGGENSSVTAAFSGGTATGDWWLVVDKDYYQLEKLCFYLVDDDQLVTVGTKRRDHIDGTGGPYDEVTEHVKKALAGPPAEKAKELDKARGALKGEGSNFRIAIDLYQFPSSGGPAKKVLIRFEGCHYIHKDHVGDKKDLQDNYGLLVPAPGFATRWPESIEIRQKGVGGISEYVRADLA